jgi:hypothetical protein
MWVLVDCPRCLSFCVNVGGAYRMLGLWWVKWMLGLLLKLIRITVRTVGCWYNIITSSINHWVASSWFSSPRIWFTVCLRQTCPTSNNLPLARRYPFQHKVPWSSHIVINTKTKDYYCSAKTASLNAVLALHPAVTCNVRLGTASTLPNLLFVLFCLLFVLFCC